MTKQVTTGKTGGQPSNRDSQQVEILLADYQTCREDDRVLVSIQAVVFSVLVTLIGLMAAAVTQTCEFSNSKSCVNVPDYLLAAAPLIPCALLAYTTMLGVSATLRSYYMRGLEEELRKYTSAPILGDLRPASYIGVITEVESLRRGRISYRLLANLVLAVVIIVFGGFTAYIGFHVANAEQIAMTVLYGGIAILLVWEVRQASVRGRTFFIKSAEQFLLDRGDTRLPQPRRRQLTEEAADERSLASYLVFPRPEDWIKWLIAPGVFLATAWLTASLGRWPTFLAVWLILEYLIYGARYQWNDVRGIDEDQSHSQRRARGRLPAGPGRRDIRRNVFISVSVGWVRLVIAFLLAVALGLTGPVLLLIILVFAIAVVYEALRSVQSPSIPKKLHPLPVALWCVVGLGYGVRAGLGFIAGGLAVTNWRTVIGIACFVAFGVMFVLMTWVLEATDYCVIDSGGTWRLKPYTGVKPHLILLLKYVPKTKNVLKTDAPCITPPGTHHNNWDGLLSPGSKEPILEKDNQLLTPWNLALAVSVILGSVLGQGLAHAYPQYALDVLAMSLSLLGAFLMMASTSRTQRLTVAGAGTLIIVSATIPFSAFPLVLLAGAPWLAITLLYLIFRGSSYQNLKDFGPQVLHAIASVRIVLRAGPLLLRAIIGDKTWRAVRSTPLATAEGSAADGPADTKETPASRTRG